MYVDDPHRIYGRIEVEIELAELSTSGTMLDLKGLSVAIREYLEKLPMSGPQMKVLDVSPVTKEWEINSQFRNGKLWDDPADKETPQ